MKTGICEKHGKVMLHEEPCSECRKEIAKLSCDCEECVEHFMARKTIEERVADIEQKLKNEGYDFQEIPKEEFEAGSAGPEKEIKIKELEKKLRLANKRIKSLVEQQVNIVKKYTGN